MSTAARATAVTGDQFFVTHCATADSVLGDPGYGIRAASATLDGPAALSGGVCAERSRAKGGRQARGELVARCSKAYLPVRAAREAGGPRDRVFSHAEPGLLAMLLYAAARILPPRFTAD